MYIHEAIRTALSDSRKVSCIRRSCWPYDRIRWVGAKILPLNTPSGCVAISPNIDDEKWVPSASDLAADDWETCL